MFNLAMQRQVNVRWARYWWGGCCLISGGLCLAPVGPVIVSPSGGPVQCRGGRAMVTGRHSQRITGGPQGGTGPEHDPNSDPDPEPDQDMSSEFEYFVEVFCVTWLFLHFLHHILA